jgi:hypothetical protein
MTPNNSNLHSRTLFAVDSFERVNDGFAPADVDALTFVFYLRAWKQIQGKLGGSLWGDDGNRKDW